MHEFRFSCNVFALRSPQEFTGYCQAAERLGYDVVLTADHLGSPSPFPPLVAAAQATRRLRVGTLVLNAGFWNSHLLAREVATVDLLTGGRLELGLGAGHMKWEFDEAGIGWEPLAGRIDKLAAAIDDLERLFTGDGYPEDRALREAYDMPALAPVQRRGFGGAGPPLIIGGSGRRVLALAARRADIVSAGGVFQVPGKPPGTLRLGTADEAAGLVGFVQEQAGARFGALELNVLIQAVVVTADREAEAARLAAERFPYLTREQVLETPFLLIGTAEEMAGQLLRQRERFGFSFITVHEPYQAAFAPVIERVRGGAGPG
jgi:probable F420-dependent oxidoreductase